MTNLEQTEEININDITNARESINLDQISEDNDYDASVFEERRKNIRLWFTGILASSLWLVLLSSVVFQLIQTSNYTKKLSELDASEDPIYIKESIQVTKEAAQDVYTFLTPLATTVTAFFFGTKDNDLS